MTAAWVARPFWAKLRDIAAIAGEKLWSEFMSVFTG